MRAIETAVVDMLILETERQEDERGSFTRTWSRRLLDARGLDSEVVDCSVATNLRAGTLRGMHFQEAPNDEAKTVRCTRGSVWDVAVDLRPESPTFRRWVGLTLSPDNLRAFYVPRGCAHGYVTLADDSEVSYLISADYNPASARGIRWDDPAFGIEWPVEIRYMSDRDANWPYL
jgi:dTDP-4-dehydrorhamnose 3,5-epimerase